MDLPKMVGRTVTEQGYTVALNGVRSVPTRLDVIERGLAGSIFRFKVEQEKPCVRRSVLTDRE